MDHYRAGKHLWSRKDDALLRRRYPHEPTARVAAALRRPLGGVYQRAQLLGLHKTKACLACQARGLRPGGRVWVTADDALLRARYPHESTAALARELRRSLPATYGRARILGLSKSAVYLASPDACRLRRGDHVGARFRFPKGHVPANKGLHRPGYSVGRGRMQETQFKKGVATNWRPVGDTRLVDGYIYRKISDVRNVPWTVNWKPEHVLRWTSVHGPVPAGHALAFKNGDRTDIRLDNLELLSRAQLMLRNTIHTLPAPLAETIQLLGRLHRQIRKRTEAHEEQDRRPA